MNKMQKRTAWATVGIVATFLIALSTIDSHVTPTQNGVLIFLFMIIAAIWGAILLDGQLD